MDHRDPRQIKGGDLNRRGVGLEDWFNFQGDFEIVGSAPDSVVVGFQRLN